MNYVGQIIRPPSEADSIILQVTVGCSHNGCTFCGAYKEKRFSIKDRSAISADLDFAARYCRKQHKMFLADGDALAVPFSRLLPLFQEIRETTPWVRRISLYASARAIRTKSIDQLRQLKALGLDRVYLGLESGSDTVLAEVNKGESAESMISAAETIGAASLFLSVSVLLGLAGTDGSREHALQTAAVLNRMQPRQIAALTLMPLTNTLLGEKYQAGSFLLPGPQGILAELQLLVGNIATPCQFYANHASNYLPIMGRLPRDREKIMALLSEAQNNRRQLVPESLRRL